MSNIFILCWILFNIAYSTKDDVLQMDTSTPMKLFTKSKEVSVLNEQKLITVHHDGWVNIGIDHAVKQKETVTFEVVARTARNTDNILRFCIGFSTKGPIYARGFIGGWKDGWCYHNDGYFFSDRKASKKRSTAFVKNEIIKLIFVKNEIKIFIEGKSIGTFDVKHLRHNKAKKFYPAISLSGPEASVEIIDFKVDKQPKPDL
eukprot:225134_1